jgi:hypothetical protein
MSTRSSSGRHRAVLPHLSYDRVRVIRIKPAIEGRLDEAVGDLAYRRFQLAYVETGSER